MNQYHLCIICLGSNHQGIEHLKKVEKELKEISCNICWGNIIETEAEGTVVSCSYFNRAALLQTTLSKSLLITEFKKIEYRHGRTHSCKQKGIISLDIDLLMYDDEIVKPADLKKKYVQLALQSIPL